MTIANPHLAESNPEIRRQNALKKWAAAGGVSVAVVLVIVKAAAFFMTGSVSILSSVLDSFFDGIASMITIVSIAHAAQPADRDHRFGHGKIEALSALAQAAFMVASAILLIHMSVQRIMVPVPVQRVETGLYTMMLSIVLTAVLIAFQKYVIRKTSSVAIAADHMHYSGDLFMNLGVLAALALGKVFDWPYFDPLFALMTSAILFNSARVVGKSAFDILMDRELPEEDRARIVGLVTAHPKVQAVHDLRTRSTGSRLFIEFHMEIDGAMTLKQAHAITEDIEETLYTAFPTAEVLIHPEPDGIDDHRIDTAIDAEK
jgi:ferrous-iron efflux pump FieF